MKRVQLSAPGLWKDKGQVKCTGWGQLGVCWASGTASPPNPAPRSTGMEARGGRSLILHLRAVLANLPAQMRLQTTGKMFAAAHAASGPLAAGRGGEHCFKQMDISALSMGGSLRLTEI